MIGHFSSGRLAIVLIDAPLRSKENTQKYLVQTIIAELMAVTKYGSGNIIYHSPKEENCVTITFEVVTV